jgi:AraC family transcriptional regulator
MRDEGRLTTQYIGRINHAIDYIEARLSRPLSLSAVSEEAGFSYYHFHRIFLLLTGETLKDYVRKRRLTEAAQALREGRRILDLAIELQFESQEAFSRAFKSRFLVPPGEYRRVGAPGLFEFSRFTLTEEHVIKLRRQMAMEADIVSLPERRYFGVERRGQNLNDLNIKLLYEAKSCMESLPSLGDRTIYTLSKTEGLGTSAETFVFCAALLGLTHSPAASWVERAVPAGTYARFSFQGQHNDLHLNVYAWIYGFWQPLSGYEFDPDCFQMETYCPTYTCLEQCPIDIYLPLRE